MADDGAKRLCAERLDMTTLVNVADLDGQVDHVSQASMRELGDFVFVEAFSMINNECRTCVQG